MITGFNTDIEHNGTVYHVQTEDKGLDAPIILSLVYVGGAILASKRSPYNDLITEGFDAQVLAERLQRQHKLICAAISAGRIEDLKRLQQRETATAVETKAAPARPRRTKRVEAEPAAPTAKEIKEPASDSGAISDNGAARANVPPGVEKNVPASEPMAAPVAEQPVQALPAEPPVAPPVEAPTPVTEVEPEEVLHVEPDDALHVSLMEEREFRAGEVVTIRVRVGRGPVDDRRAVADAKVTVKILGSEFRPLMLRSKTDADGIAIVHAWLPRFTTGRAAVLIRAVADDYAAELRRVIRH